MMDYHQEFPYTSEETGLQTKALEIKELRKMKLQALEIKASEIKALEIEKLHAKIEALKTKEAFYKHKIKDLNYIVQKLLDRIRKFHNKSKREN